MSEEKVSIKDFMSHIQTQAQSNQDTAIALAEIRTMTREILDQTKKTNGRVTKLEQDMSYVKPHVDDMLKKENERRELKRKMMWFWIERAFWFGLLIISLVLEFTGSINIFK